MKLRVLLIVASLLTLLNSGCGRRGQLQEPVPRVPQPVPDFRVVQQADRLLFTWTVPAAYLNGSPLEVAAVEIRAMEVEGEEISAEKSRESFMRYARPLTLLGIGRLEAGKNRAVLQLEMEKVSGKNYLFGLRTRGRKGGWSEISNLLAFKPEVLPLPPSGLRAVVEEHMISLSWETPATLSDGRPLTEKIFYNLYRSEGQEFRLINDQPLTRTRFEDLNFSFGHTYRYLVRSVVMRAAESRESADSEILEIKAVDLFPPAPPAEVRALSGSEGVTISWLPGPERDLAGYRVYRAREDSSGEETPVLLTPENLTVPVFLDRTVEKNTSYVYSISAVDNSGNESQVARIRVKT